MLIDVSQYNGTEKLVILAFIILILVTTVKAVIRGIKEGIMTALDIKDGKSMEEVRKKDKERMEREKAEEKKKFNSGIYRITHPLEYLNSELFSKAGDLLKRRKDNGKK